MADMRPGSPEGDREAAQEREALDRLSKRIDTAREGVAARKPKAPGKYQGLSIAWRMVLELVIGCAFGAAVGYAIDEATGLRPLFLVVFGGLGFAAGVKTMMASARQMQRNSEATNGKVGAAPAAHGNDGDGLGG